jgi:hypothetical protein
MKILPSSSPWWSAILTFLRGHQDELGTIWQGSEARDAKSLAAEGQRLRVCFRNISDQTLILCWVDSKGTPHHFYPLHPSTQPYNDLVTKEDRVESTQSGHVFLLVAAPDTDETIRNKSLQGTTLVGAYRADETTASPDGTRENTIHLITATHTRTDCPACMECFRHPFLRRRDTKKKEDNNPGATDEQQQEENDPCWKLSVRQAFFDSAPIDTSQKCYNSLCLHEEWTIKAQDNWHGDNPDLEKTFQDDLRIALECLPPHARQRLSQTTPLWLNRTLKYGPAACPVQGQGMCFHPGSDWLVRNGMNPDKRHGVELYCGEDYKKSRDYWAPGGLLLHEFSHAYHCICLPAGYDNVPVKACYEAAMKDGLYESVSVHGPQGPKSKAYACQDAMEYFAELSTAFLGGRDERVEFNKWYPFTRKQIQKHDPRAYELLKTVWKVDDDEDTSYV